MTIYSIPTVVNSTQSLPGHDSTNVVLGGGKGWSKSKTEINLGMPYFN